MSPLLISLILFAIFALLFLVIAKGKSLDEVLLADGEEPLYDEEGLSVVEDPDVGESTRYIRSRVIVTTGRIIIAQLPVFSKKYQLLIVLYREGGEAPEKTGLEGRIKTGLIDRDGVTLVQEGKERGVHLRPRGFSLFNRESTTLQVLTERGDELYTILTDQQTSQPAAAGGRT